MTGARRLREPNMHPSPTPLSLATLRSSLAPWWTPSERAGGRPLIAGVLSGTSADGIDVVLARPEAEVGASSAPVLRGLEAAAFATEPFEPGLAARVRAVLEGELLTLAGVAALDRDLGLAFGAAARAVADRHRLGPLALVASHGQTVFHHDGREEFGKITLQLGDGDFVAEAAGVPVVSDFRVRDCAAGGEGAPLVGLVDDVLFRGAPRPLAVLNLGGIANWTLLMGPGGVVRAFDTGPAGVLLDGLSRRRLGRPYDRGGEVAAAGRVHDESLRRWLDVPEVQDIKAAGEPSSTGLDTFNSSWVDGIEAAGLPTEELMATSCALVAETAARGLVGALARLAEGGEWAPGPPGSPPGSPMGTLPGGIRVVVAGGGVHNLTLMRQLRERTERALARAGGALDGFGSSATVGVPPDAREALAFAALGVRFLLGEPSTSRGTTGASTGRILGKWSPGIVG